MKTSYLDNSATTRMDPRVQEVVARTLRDAYGNPSSLHSAGRFSRRVVDDSREKIAVALGVDEKEILFTSGATEANNMVFRGISKERGNHIVTTAVEHPSVLAVCSALRKEGWDVSLLPVDSDGRIFSEAISEQVRPETALISVMWANNEVGSIQPVTEIAMQKGVLFHSDGAQAVGKTPISLEGIDFFTLSAHKLHGPKGIGALFLRKGTAVKPLLLGGGQEFEKRGGTENVALIAGFAEAVDLAIRERETNRKKMESARKELETAIRALPDIDVLGCDSDRLPNILNVCIEGLDAEALVLALDSEGVHVSSGSACASLSTEPSHVLLAMGIGMEKAKTSIRFSVAADTAPEEILYAKETIPRVIARLRRFSGKNTNE